MTEKELKRKLKEFAPKVWRPFDRETYRQEWRGNTGLTSPDHHSDYHSDHHMTHPDVEKIDIK